MANCGLPSAVLDKQDELDPEVDTHDISGRGSSRTSGDWLPFCDNYIFCPIVSSFVAKLKENVTAETRFISERRECKLSFIIV